MSHYLWAINLVFISLCSLFAAKSTGTIIGSSIEPTIEPSQAGKNKATISTKPQGKRNLDPISERNLLDAKKEDLTPVAEVDESKKATEAAAAVERKEGELPPDDEMKDCTLPGDVVGVIFANNPKWSMVVYVNKKDKESNVFSVGDNPAIDEGYTLVAVRDRKIDLIHGEENNESSPPSIVLINSENQYELCPLGNEPKKAKAAPKPAAKTAEADSGNKDDIGSSVQKIDDFNYAVEKDEIDRVMNNLSKVASQARLVPNFKDGKSNGFKIFSIRPGSIFGKLGLKNGDIIQKVNGYEMNSPDKALELYQKLKETSSLGVEIMRHGKTENINVSIH